MYSKIQTKIRKISIPRNSTIRQALHAIDDGAIGIALLVDPQTNMFEGIITDGDIRRGLLKGLGLESSIQTISNPKPIVAREGMSTEEITGQFSDPVRAIPILDNIGQVVDLALFDRRMHLPVAEPFLSTQELKYVTECVVTGWVSSSGKFVTTFEKMFGDFCNTQNAVATSSGTAALHLALLAAGIGPGDEVIVPTLTFIATANAVRYTGAKPVFVDSEARTWNIDPDQMDQSITPNTKAIIPVHLYGHPADMDPIMEIAKNHNIIVIEDAAEAHGAEYKGHRVGGIGDIGVFSFYGNKIVTTGEGGMIVTNNSELAEKTRVLRDHGMSKTRRYWHTVLGYNYRLTNIQAALGVGQMEKVDLIIEKKIEIANLYSDKLRNIPGITLPPKNEWAKNVYWMYSILIDENEFGMNRDILLQKLEQQDIETRPFFPPIHTQPIYNTGEKLPISEQLSQQGLNLPSSVMIQPEQIEQICNHIIQLTGTNS